MLLVGDPHAKVEDLDDCQRLVDHVCKVGYGYDLIVFLGDQMHSHSIVYSQVRKFWLDAQKQLVRSKATIVFLVGNHDLAGNGDASCHSMLGLNEPGCVVIDRPTRLPGIPILFVPYMDDPERFVEVCKDNESQKIVVCHQTFDGSHYENGFYAKDGIDPNLVPQDQIFSGHIHTPQQFGKVVYPGSPRWQTVSDANVSRSLLEVVIEDDVVVSTKKHSVDEVCRKIVHAKWTPDSSEIPKVNERDVVVVDLVGPAGWIEEKKKTIHGWRIRCHPTDGPSTVLKESEGVVASVARYLGSYESKFGTSKAVLSGMLKEKLGIDVAV